LKETNERNEWDLNAEQKVVVLEDPFRSFGCEAGRSKILILVLCLSITLVNSDGLFPEDLCHLEKVDEWFPEDSSPLEEDAKKLLDDNTFETFNLYNKLYKCSEKAIRVVNQFASQIQIINEQYKKIVNEIETNNGKAWDVNLKGEQKYFKNLAYEFRVRSHCINKWIRPRTRFLINKDIDYKVLNLIRKEINEDKDTIDYIEKMLDYGVKLLEKLLNSRGKNAGRIIDLTNRIKQAIVSKEFGKKTDNAVSLIKRLRDKYRRTNFMEELFPKQSNFVDVVA